MIGWVFFRADSLEYAIYFLKCMAGFAENSIAVPFDTFYYINCEVIFIAFVGIIGSMPIVSMGKRIYVYIAEKIEARIPNVINFSLSLVTLVFFLGVFMTSIMYLASGTYNPFIYFRF